MKTFETWSDFSKGVRDELSHKFSIRDSELELDDFGDDEVLIELMQDSEEKGLTAYSFRREFDDFLIYIGAYPQVSKEQYEDMEIGACSYNGIRRLSKRSHFRFRGNAIYHAGVNTDFSYVSIWAEEQEQ